MLFGILAQISEQESLLEHINYGPWGPNPAMYAIVPCAVVVLASGIYGLMMARKKPSRLTHAMLLHGFVLTTVMAIGTVTCLLDVRSSVGTFETSGVPDPFQVMRDQSSIAMNGIRFAVIVVVGALLGISAMISKKRCSA